MQALQSSSQSPCRRQQRRRRLAATSLPDALVSPAHLTSHPEAAALLCRCSLACQAAGNGRLPRSQPQPVTECRLDDTACWNNLPRLRRLNANASGRRSGQAAADWRASDARSTWLVGNSFGQPMAAFRSVLHRHPTTTCPMQPTSSPIGSPQRLIVLAHQPRWSTGSRWSPERTPANAFRQPGPPAGPGAAQAPCQAL